MLSALSNPQHRRYFYRVAISLVILAQFLRLIPEDSFTVIANVISAVFGITTPALALPNTPTPPTNHAE